MYLIVENDVRLIRRGLVLRNLGLLEASKLVFGHLAAKGLAMVFTWEADVRQLAGAYSRLEPNETYLAHMYGGVILPGFGDIVFLNSRWPNPNTLYVRLLHKVPELGEYGELIWMPPLEGGWGTLESQTHGRYQAAGFGLRGKTPRLEDSQVVPSVNVKAQPRPGIFKRILNFMVG